MSRLPPPFNHFSIFFTFPENVIARSVFKGPGACISIYQPHFNIFQLSRKLKKGIAHSVQGPGARISIYQGDPSNSNGKKKNSLRA